MRVGAVDRRLEVGLRCGREDRRGCPGRAGRVRHRERVVAGDAGRLDHDPLHRVDRVDGRSLPRRAVDHVRDDRLRDVAADREQAIQLRERLCRLVDIEDIVALAEIDGGVPGDRVDVDDVVAAAGVELHLGAGRRVVDDELVRAVAEVDLEILDVLECDAAGLERRAVRTRADRPVAAHAEAGDPELVERNSRRAVGVVVQGARLVEEAAVRCRVVLAGVGREVRRVVVDRRVVAVVDPHDVGRRVLVDEQVRVRRVERVRAGAVRDAGVAVNGLNHCVVERQPSTCRRPLPTALLMIRTLFFAGPDVISIEKSFRSAAVSGGADPSVARRRELIRVEGRVLPRDVELVAVLRDGDHLAGEARQRQRGRSASGVRSRRRGAGRSSPSRRRW